MKIAKSRLSAKLRLPIAVIAGLVVVVVAVYAWFVHGNQTSYPPCTSLEYNRLQSLWSSVSLPSGASVVSGPTKSCTTRGLGKLTAVGYVVNTGSYANYIALENAFRTSLGKNHLSPIQSSKDQLEMARGANTAFYMIPANQDAGVSGLLANIIFQDGPI
jgi:hypothetical protein